MCEPAVEKIECLNGGCGFASSGSALSGVGAVESAEDGFPLSTHFVGVNHSSKPFAGEAFDRLKAAEAATFIEQIEPASEHFGVEGSGHVQGGVAHGFGFESARGKAPEEACIRVERGCVGAHSRILRVGVGQHDESVQVFHRPSRADELAREPVEQFRVRGFCAVDAEVAGGFDDARAEVALPDAVGHHASSERVLGRCKPFRESLPAFGVGSGFGEFQHAEHFGDGWLNGTLGLLGIATGQESDFVGFSEGAGED